MNNYYLNVNNFQIFILCIIHFISDSDAIVK